jgi:hypothetical protein
MTDLLINLHQQIGETWFLVFSTAIAVVLCFWSIPITTDYMVNASAGLAGKYLGPSQRTLAINASTNNPELVSMLVAFVLGRIGGLANPLGSNFANIYLMFLVAPAIVLFKWVLMGKSKDVKAFFVLIKNEKKLVIWHILMSLAMFYFSTFAYWCMTGVSQFKALPESQEPRSGVYLLIGGITCAIGIAVFIYFENKLKAKRPELFEDISDEDHHPSWRWFFFGSAGLIVSCYILNTFFLACSEIYSSSLAVVFGSAIFAGLHYFVGSLVTSLPETIVAIKNYDKINRHDLNTAMASASQSNMVNLAIGALGSVIVGVFLLLGFNYQL